MKNNRRDFIKLSGIAGLSVTTGGFMKSYGSDFNYDDSNLPQDIMDFEKKAYPAL